MTNRNKIIASLVVLILGTLMFTGVLDQKGYEYTEQGIKRGLVTFAIARGLNGVISVAQGTEVAIEPVGVGVTFAPGEILDPINDLIERFSWIVLASSVSLGAQSILLTMTEWIWFGVVVGLFLITTMIAIWNKSLFSNSVKTTLYKATIILLILRLAVPLVAMLNQGVYTVFLEPQYEESKLELEQTTLRLEENTQSPQVTERELGFIDRAKQMFDDASNAIDIDQNLSELRDIAANISQSVLNMIVVFVLQTLIFPLLFLWMSYRGIILVANADL